MDCNRFPAQKTLSPLILALALIVVPVSDAGATGKNNLKDSRVSNQYEGSSNSDNCEKARGNSHKNDLSRHCGQGNTNWWDKERARRLTELGNFLGENEDVWLAYRYTPIGIKQNPLNFVGESMIVFRLLAEIFPDIWGAPEDKMANVGFGPDPFDPTNVLPQGQGYALSETFSIDDLGDDGKDLNVNYVTFTCSGCHSGTVIGPNGSRIGLVGSASQLGNFFGKIYQTVKDPRWTAENFRNVLSSKPLGWVYGKVDMLPQEIYERELFQLPGGAEYFLEEVKFISVAGVNKEQATLGQFTYNIPNAPLAAGMPGSLDVFSLAAINQCTPDADDPSNSTPPYCGTTILPGAPGPADIPAVWEMDERPAFQWDNSIGNLYYREVFASMATTAGSGKAVNIDNVVRMADFAEGLPAHPYPFSVERDAAARGANIFRYACAHCHSAGNTTLFTPDELGTDPNRADIFSEGLIAGLIEEARVACTVPECFEDDGSEVPSDEILQSTLAYSTTPLAGIWSTAPYLHNGSVPTLYHLLTGERPEEFWRGNYTYDEKHVGFTWEISTNDSLAMIYDTRLAGYSNKGHSGPEYNGHIDWDKEPRKLWDLLEYLKTL